MYIRQMYIWFVHVCVCVSCLKKILRKISITYCFSGTVRPRILQSDWLRYCRLLRLSCRLLQLSCRLLQLSRRLLRFTSRCRTWDEWNWIVWISLVFHWFLLPESLFLKIKCNLFFFLPPTPRLETSKVMTKIIVTSPSTSYFYIKYRLTWW